MTETHDRRVRTGASRVDAGPEPTGWVGWILFASTMLILIGSFQAIAGFVAIFKDRYYALASEDLVVSVDYTAWGWVHLALGVLAVVAGYGLMSGRMWARIVAVLTVSIAALVNLAFLGAAPVWGTILIAMDVLVIWAVTVHGGEMKTLNPPY